MSQKGFLGILFLVVALFSASWNLYSGWILSGPSGASPEGHLIRGIVTTAACFVGNILCLSTASRSQFSLRQLLSENQIAEAGYADFQNYFERCSLFAWISMGAVFPSLITGTTSQPGNFPWVHGPLGIFLVISYTLALVHWIALIPRLKRLKTRF